MYKMCYGNKLLVLGGVLCENVRADIVNADAVRNFCFVVNIYCI